MKKYLTAALRGRNPDNPIERARSNGKYQQRLEIGGDIANTITTVSKDSLVIEIENEKHFKKDA